MSSPRFEAFLARLYSDGMCLERFMREPERVIAEHGLDEHEQQAALAMDRVGLLMAARSYAHKREGRRKR